MYKKFCKILDDEEGVKSHDQFFLLAPEFDLFDLLVRAEAPSLRLCEVLTFVEWLGWH